MNRERIFSVDSQGSVESTVTSQRSPRQLRGMLVKTEEGDISVPPGLAYIPHEHGTFLLDPENHRIYDYENSTWHQVPTEVGSREFIDSLSN